LSVDVQDILARSSVTSISPLYAVASAVSWATTVSCFENQLGKHRRRHSTKGMKEECVKLELRRTLMLSTDVEQKKRSVVVDNTDPCLHRQAGVRSLVDHNQGSVPCVPESLVQLEFAGAGNRWRLWVQRM
jgi:hypothetical protein